MYRRAMLVLVAATLAACSEPAKKTPSTAAGKAPAAKAAAAASATAAEKPAEAEAAVLEYAYSPVGKRDPFRSAIDDAIAKPGESPAGSPNCGPLCKWELEQLKLVAVISGISNPLAMVEDPSGKGYVVRRGTFIGKRNGKVSQIRSGELVVSEIFKDQMGKPHLNQIVIKLPVDEKAPIEDQNLLGAEVIQ